MRTQRLLPMLVLALAIVVAGCSDQDQPVTEAPVIAPSEEAAPTAAPPPPGLAPAEAGTPGPSVNDTLLRRDTAEGIPVPREP